MPAKIRVLHTEVGGTYGGSLRALELYLQFADRTRFEHDVLLYYPTPGAENLAPLAGTVHVLFDSVPLRLTDPSPPAKLTSSLKRSPIGTGLGELREWLVPLESTSTASRIRKLLKAHSYDLIHVNNTFTHQPAMVMAARWSGIPAVSHIRNPVANLSFNHMLMRSLKLVVTVSKNYEEQLAAWELRVPVHTCHDGVIAPAADAAAAAQIRASLTGAGEILIGSVGRLHEQKGYDDLIRAARLVLDQRPNVRFAIAGDGPMRAELEALIHSLNLVGRFQLCGFRNDVSNFVSALDLFVSSSRWEGLPIAVVEAMLLRRPVVATYVGGVAEVVKPGATGYLVPSGDPQTLAAALLQALADQEAHPGRFLDEARRRAAQLTDPERSARRFEQLIADYCRLT